MEENYKEKYLELLNKVRLAKKEWEDHTSKYQVWKEAFEKASITQEYLAQKLKEVIETGNNIEKIRAVIHYEKLTGKRIESGEIDESLFETDRQKCAIKGCEWSYNTDTHHLDHNHGNNNPDNLMKLCPNHHYLHHRKGIRLEDLYKFN